jgi:pilus assembly protein CpaB
MTGKARSFFSAGWSGKARELFPLVAGLLLTVLALAAAGKRIGAIEKEIRRQANPVEVVVASAPISAGEEFSPGNLAKKPVPASGTGKRNVPAADFELLLGARAKSAIDPGEPVLWTDVEEPFEADAFSKTVPKGKRAFTVGVDETSSFCGLLQPGDRVDLLARNAETKTGVWIRDIPVIAVDRHLNRLARPADSSEASAVTLMVSPAEGIAIAAASASGKLFWFLRNPDDEPVPVVRPAARSGFPAVELWKGGIRVTQPQPGERSAL